jgi:cyclopropane-fatty-acyl-phospholipid synthase
VGRAQALEKLLATGNNSSIAIRMFDGSVAGAPDATTTLDIRSEQALAYVATGKGDLGLARAYVTGNIEVEGDLYTALKEVMVLDIQMPIAERLRMLRQLGGFKLLRRPPLPPQEVQLSGRKHSRERDAAAISHHYDVSNKFYEWLLGPSMAYTCAVYPSYESTLEEAQFEKHDLVARKLALEPGMRLLDVGCGWGGMVVHAARYYGVKTLGVTLSKRQAEWAQKAIADAGLGELAEVRHMDYRDVAEGDFDVVSSIGLTEHIGLTGIPAYFKALYDKLRPGGRLLNHCITEPSDEMALHKGWFISKYVFPDGDLPGAGRLITQMQSTGFEVQHEENLREHYAMTTKAWSENLDRHWDEAVEEVGIGTARVWRLYLAGVRLGFERNRIQLHQILGTRPGGSFPLRPNWNTRVVEPGPDTRAVLAE